MSTRKNISSDILGTPPFTKKSVKRLARKTVEHLPNPLRDAAHIARDFRAAFGHYPNIVFPKTFNEKVQVRKIFDRRRRLLIWADKYAVREYVRTKIGDAVLPTWYHVTDDPHDIPFEKLPMKYVVKTTHGSGWVQIVSNIDFVRVDLYDAGGKIYFGELTNTPGNGLMKFIPSSWDEVLGGFWKMRFCPAIKV